MAACPARWRRRGWQWGHPEACRSRELAYSFVLHLLLYIIIRNGPIHFTLGTFIAVVLLVVAMDNCRANLRMPLLLQNRSLQFFKKYSSSCVCSRPSCIWQQIFKLTNKYQLIHRSQGGLKEPLIQNTLPHQKKRFLRLTPPPQHEAEMVIALSSFHTYISILPLHADASSHS